MTLLLYLGLQRWRLVSVAKLEYRKIGTRKIGGSTVSYLSSTFVTTQIPFKRNIKASETGLLFFIFQDIFVTYGKCTHHIKKMYILDH